MSKFALGPTNLLNEIRVVKCREKVRNVWSYNSTATYILIAWPLVTILIPTLSTDATVKYVQENESII
jgi:hypothetical protein